MMEYLKLLRVKHYIKNFLIFIPLFFSGYLYDLKKIHYCFIGFLCFCFVSSSIYILNDIKDLEKDKKHPTKCNRPLASGKIKISTGIIMLVASLIISIGLSIYLLNLYAGIILSVYFICNLLYSLKLKNVPIVDIAILTSGFILRVFYGGALIDVSISSWLFLVIMSGSLFMVFGKRRNELKKQIRILLELKILKNS